jgi:hypothetical protein
LLLILIDRSGDKFFTLILNLLLIVHYDLNESLSSYSFISFKTILLL